VTGVSRRRGIGHAIARRLIDMGARVFVQGWAPHNESQPWGADAAGVAGLARELGAESGEFDFLDPRGAEECVAAAHAALGRLDILVANHAASCDQSLEQLTAEAIDRTLAVNVRSTLMLVKAFAERHAAPPAGRVILFTSGQHRGPMTRELPYAASKGALHQLTETLAAELAPRGILLNTVNPGPTDTGWATPEIHARALAAMPLGRWGEPDDAARLVAWLCTDDARWIVGQVIDSEGGFRLTP
jgi:3-oxoacyl-[acyl-carrier protein] reductase